MADLGQDAALARLGAVEDEPANPAQLMWEELSDLGNARRLIARYRDRLLYEPAIGWLGWNGRFWDRDAGETLAHHAAHETAQAVRDEAAAMKRHIAEKMAEGKLSQDDAQALAEREKKLYGWAVVSGNAGKTAAMLSQATHYLQVRADDLDPEDFALNVENGLLRFGLGQGDVLDVKLHPHDPADRITRMAAVAYDPAATAPKWIETLNMVLPDAGMRAYFQAWMGYVMTGSTREQRMLMLQGRGGDGKSTVMNTLRRLLGGYGYAADVRSFLDEGMRGGADASPDLARLAGDVRLVGVSEPKRGARLSESMIKSVTGGAPLMARFLNREFFEFKPGFKLILECNAKPRISGDDDGIWRRIDMILFTVQIPEALVDRELEDKLVAEAPGILNWLLEGARMWLLDGLVRPLAVIEAVEDYRRSANPFGEWFSERLDLVADHKERSSDLYNDYKLWAEDNGHEPVSQRAFGLACADRQIISCGKDSAGKKLRRGARLRPYENHGAEAGKGGRFDDRI